MRHALRIDTEGQPTLLDLDAPEGSLKVLQTAVDGLIEPVRVSTGFEMYVNEEGLFRDDFGLNGWALAAFGVTIKGAVVLTGLVDDEGDTLGLTAEDVRILSSGKIDPASN
jgi:hypothetical protein